MNDKKEYKLSVSGFTYEVEEKVFTEFRKMERREKYLYEQEKINHVSYFSTEDEIEYTSDNLEDEVINQILCQQIFTYVRTLSLLEKQIFELIFVRGMSLRKAAKVLNISVTTLQYRKEKLRQKLISCTKT